MENNESNKIPFKEFLDKSTNLITIFGVLNALFIYSSTLTDKDVTDFFLPSFFALSMLVWYQIIRFTLKSSNGTWEFQAFYFLVCSIGIGLAMYYIHTFSGLLKIFALFIILGVLIYLIAKWLLNLFTKPITKLKRRGARENIFYLILFISILISFVLLSFARPIIKPLFCKVPQGNINNISNP